MRTTARFLRTEAPTVDEQERGAEIIFVYLKQGTEVRILGATSYESWHQWGASEEFLWLNVDRIQQWRDYKRTIINE